MPWTHSTARNATGSTPRAAGGLRETTTRLALAVAVVPPPALRRRVLAAAAPDARIMKQPISVGGVAIVVVSAAR